MKNNILIPRNIESRKEKLRQDRIKLLSHEIIEGGLEIDELFEGIPKELIKVKEIKGSVDLLINKGYIPEWLKNVKISGYFNCVENNLKTLNNCPQHIGGYFDCSRNNLTSLKGCPQYVNGNFYCNNNKLTSLKGCPKHIGINIHSYGNLKILKLQKELNFNGIHIH